MVILDMPVTSFSPPEEIRGWIVQLERTRHDPDVEPLDLMVIDMYLEMAHAWLEPGRTHVTPDRDHAA